MVKHTHGKARCRRMLSRKIKLLVEEGKPQKQAIAIAFSSLRKKGCKI